MSATFRSNRFLTADGGFDVASMMRRAWVMARHKAQFRDKPATAFLGEMLRSIWAEAKINRAARSPPSAEMLREAARAFCSGALAGLTAPVDMDGWSNGQRFAGSYERQCAWNAEYSRRELANSLAALDLALHRIAASNDITRHLQAAE